VLLCIATDNISVIDVSSLSRCPPCRQFTPQLVKFYEAMQRAKRGLEIVWISGDRSQQDFLSYYQHMPWLAVPMDKAATYTQSLGAKYQLKGIPHLVLLDSEGKVLSLDARTQVMKDPYGLQFPWQGPSLGRLVPSSVRNLVIKQLSSLKMGLKNLLHKLLQRILPASIVKRIMR
jgi:nucleoredoxin